MPFLKPTSDEEHKHTRLQQVGPNAFQLMEGFRYREPGSTGEPYVVNAHDLNAGPKGNSTDLASVPPFLWWFVASIGRQTRPAVMHDQLIGEIDRTEADRLFRVSLREVRVSWLRRWLMWAAVTLATMASKSKLQLAGFIIHLAAFVVVLGMWLFGSWPVWWVVAIGLTGFVWGVRLWPLAVVGVVLMLVPTIVVWVAILIVAAIDGIAWIIGKLANKEPAPPTVVPYRDEGQF